MDVCPEPRGSSPASGVAALLQGPPKLQAALVGGDVCRPWGPGSGSAAGWLQHLGALLGANADNHSWEVLRQLAQVPREW